MGHRTRFHRRHVYRRPAARYAWRVVRRSQVRQVLRALEALYRR
jgi:hypothetical protein